MFRIFRLMTVGSLAVMLFFSFFAVPASRSLVYAARSTDANKAVIRWAYASPFIGNLVTSKL